ncbi:MAG: DNA repair protein RecO [Bacteroidales bacterium]|nr:DNA repair protein RecO [Bacteroidales bacterium]MDZ4205299.1 DNA repair protein RecO [Bacteroidales bacterium]
MLHNTRGIVLYHFRYSETSIIARIYTEKFGLQSYLIKSVRRHGSPIRISMFEHLSLLDMVVYRKENRELQNIKEVQVLHPFRSIHNDIRKSSQALFINEVFSKSVKEEEGNAALFDFLLNTIVALDDPTAFSPHFHISFLILLTKFLGFAPRQNYAPGYCFNLREGLFEPFPPLHLHYIEAGQARIFNLLLMGQPNPDHTVNIPSADRKVLLAKLIEFYQLHLPTFTNLHSPVVLSEVLGG